MRLPWLMAAVCGLTAARSSSIFFPEDQRGQCVTHAGVLGTCVLATAQRCALYPTIGHLIIAQPKVCKFIGNDPVICCPTDSVLPDTTDPSPTTAPTPPPSTPGPTPPPPTPPPTTPAPTPAPTRTPPPTTPAPPPPTTPAPPPTTPAPPPTTPAPPPTTPAPPPSTPAPPPTTPAPPPPTPTPSPDGLGDRLVGCGVAQPQAAFVSGGEYSAARPSTGRSQAVQLGRQPWAALVGLRTDSGAVAWICGGALVSERLVVTAAHCAVLGGTPDQLAVRLGEHDLDTQSDGGTTERRVVAVRRHPQYRQPSQRNDLALLLLDRPVLPSGRVRRVCLPAPAAASSDIVAPGAPLQLPAFGLSGQLTGSDPADHGRLTTTSAAAAPMADCSALVDPLPHAGFIFPHGLSASSELCVLPAAGACAHDSGGPVLGGAAGEPAQLVGLRLLSGCQPGQPEVVLRVDNYVDFIWSGELEMLEEFKNRAQ